MTPKEKAKDIIVKLMEITPDYIIKENNIAFELCRQHALVAVDDIISIVPSVYLTDDEEIHSGHYQYWQEVKQEIEKL